MNEFELRRQLTALQREREPTRDLWPEIAARMAPAPGVQPVPAPQLARTQRAWPWAIAAVLMLMLAGTANMEQQRQQRVAAASQAEAAEHVRSAVAQLDASYRAADAELASYPGAGGVYAVPALEHANATLTAAEYELRDALMRQPRAEFLLDLLARAKAKRLSVERLRRAA